MRELVVDGVAMALRCQVLCLARQPYYRWLAAPAPVADLAQAYRANALFDAHLDDPAFGYRYLGAEARSRRRGDGRADRVADLE